MTAFVGEGQTVTGFANVEEAFSDRFGAPAGDAVAGRGRAQGARRQLHQRRPIEGVRGPRGRLITGQQQYSGHKVPQMVIEALTI